MKLKKVVILAVVILAVLGIFWLRPRNPQNIQMNNQTCPVTGNRVKDDCIYTHKGRVYKLCSDECKKPLSENPDKFLCDP
jgi:YHS domain-containing protein